MYKLLSFDTALFGYPVGRIIGGNLKEALHEMSKKKIHLGYLFLSADNQKRNSDAIRNGGILVDEKVTYAINIKNSRNHNPAVTSYAQKTVSRGLLELALESGRFSRFLNDRHFVHNEYKKLYTAWISGAVRRKNAFDVLVYGTKGMITLEPEGRIGLFAVGKRYRGRGVGTALVHEALTYFRARGFKQITVATQKRNYIACRFYKHVGGLIQKVETVYHFWL